MSKLNIAIFALLATIFITSCGKDDEVEVPYNTLLAGTESKSWVITAYTVNGEDHYQLQKECSKDNLHVFHTDGRLEIYQGEEKCSPDAEDLIRTGSWSINEEKEEFTWRATYKILSITEKRFVIKYTDPQSEHIMTMESVD